MSEEDVRVGLRDAVADEPPLDFDPDALVATARQVTRRRALVAAGVATVAVAVAAVAIPGALGRGPTQVAEQPTVTSATTAPKPSQWLAQPVEPVEYSPDQLRSRSQEMAGQLRQTVPAVLSDASEFAYGEFGGEASGEFYEGQTSVNAAVSFTVDDARYSIFVTVWVPGGANELLDTVCAGSGAYCKQLGEEDGGPVVATTDDLGDQTISTVYHFRKDGGVVQVAAYNYDMTGTPKYMPTIPVTLQQLTRLATDPELGL
jgi:hypothetical protein